MQEIYGKTQQYSSTFIVSLLKNESAHEILNCNVT